MTSTGLDVADDQGDLPAVPIPWGRRGPALIRVLIVDDHRTLAELLALSLSGQPDLELVGHAANPAQCMQLVAEHQPDVVLMDYSMPEGNGLDLTRVVRAQHPSIRIIMLTGSTDPQLVVRAAMAGVSAFLPKSGRLADILSAIRAAPMAGMNVSTDLITTLVSPPAPRGEPMPRLTARERDVLTLLAGGSDVRRVARELGISLNTCRGYVKAILHKLGAHSQLEAVAIARRLDLIGSGG